MKPPAKHTPQPDHNTTMKKPNLPPGDWNVSKHATPEGIHQFGIYAGDSPSDFVIVKGERPIADAHAA